MILKTLTQAGLGIAMALSASLALASGSDGGSSAETGDAALYNMGKSVYSSKLACSGCPLAGKNLDAAVARDLLAKKPAVDLSAKETAALDGYLKRRFKL